MADKKLTVEMVPEASTQGSQPSGEKQKRKGLPAAGEPWSPVKHDPVVMGRIARALEGVPPNVVRRLQSYIGSVVEVAGQEPAHPQLIGGNAQWDAGARAMKQAG
jgi:hypothetical protein